MKTLTRDDTEHGKEYVLKSEADAIESERATLWRRCRDLEAGVKRPQDGEPRFRVSDDGRTISDEDFIFDVLIRVGGDFGDDALRTSYAQWMCDALNEADKHLPREPRDA